MDYRKIVVPFLDNLTIRKKADLFRKRFWDNSIPVDIESIIDIKLKIDIVPKSSLQDNFEIDALISSNWKMIYIDRNRFLDDRFQNRLRFSLAHEVGHFVLHKELYKGFRVRNPADFYKFYKEIPEKQYSYLETQANKFANYLLVPSDTLIFRKNKILREKDELILPKKLQEIDKKTLNSYLAVQISKIFGVSEKVAEIALNDVEG